MVGPLAFLRTNDPVIKAIIDAIKWVIPMTFESILYVLRNKIRCRVPCKLKRNTELYVYEAEL